jgi:hypothetical protein
MRRQSGDALTNPNPSSTIPSRERKRRRMRFEGGRGYRSQILKKYYL